MPGITPTRNGFHSWAVLETVKRLLRYLFPWPHLHRLERENAQLRMQVKGIPVLLEFIKRRHRLEVNFNPRSNPKFSLLK